MPIAQVPPERQCLFEGRDLRVLHDPRPSAAAVVCFNWVGYRAAPMRFDADQLMHRLGYAAVGVVSLRDHWYCSPEMDQVVPLVRRALQGHPQRLGLGFSMGGYAALRHSAALNLTHVLAFSPQWSIDPDEAAWDPRYRRHARPEHRGMGLKAGQLAGRICLLHDPLLDVDHRHAERIMAAGVVDTLPITHADHDTIKIVAGEVGMRGLLRACLADDLPAMRAVIRLRKKHSPLYRAHLFAHRGQRWLQAGNLAAAQRWLNLARAAEAQPGQSAATQHLVAQLQRCQFRPS